MNGTYDVAQICLNGHVINSGTRSNPEHNKNYCSYCGEATITNCGHCNVAIKGRYTIKGRISASSFHPSRYCESCGKPYTWTERSQQAITELIEFSELTVIDKQDLKKSVIDLVENGPKTTLAVLKYKSYVQKAGIEIAKGLKEILVEVVSESVKKAIWGDAKL